MTCSLAVKILTPSAEQGQYYQYSRHNHPLTKRVVFEIKQQLIFIQIARELDVTGISEILVLVLLIACILILPRLFKGEEANQKKSSDRKIKNLDTKARIGIVLSIVYPVSMALYLRPWDGHLIAYLSAGVFPVLLVWAMIWIVAGKKG